MKVQVLIIGLLSLTVKTFGQAYSRIDKKDLKNFIKTLTSDSLEGRETGTPGQKKAEKFISKRFETLGLSPFDQNSYLQKFKLNKIYWRQVYLKTPSKTLKNFENMVLQGNHDQNDEVEKEIVFGGTGSNSELNQIDVEGRFVLVFVKNLRSYHDINRNLEKRKAFGLIAANPQNDNQFGVIKRTFKDHELQKRVILPTPDTFKNRFSQFDTLKLVNTILIPNTELKTISALSQKKLMELIREGRIKDAPITKVKAKFERINEEIETSNVIGTIKGKTDKLIVISAHYDHLGKIKNKFFPGADDNASGTSALLELAEEFSNASDLNYGIMFIATSAEESGLLGSMYHVNASTFRPENIICALNLDMISRSDENHSNPNYLYCIGSDQSKEIDNLIKRADELYKECSFDFSLNNSKDFTGLFTRSDQYSFYKKGVLAIQFFSGLHADYHKETDTVEKIDFENLEKRVRLISMVITLLQKEGLK